jgi:fluoride exporter
MIDIAVWIGVVLLGGVGAVARFLVDRAISLRAGREFPYGTLLVNVSGALLLGALTGLALDERMALLAGTAVVGSYTTFSTWMFETHRLGEDRRVPGMAGNVVVSIVVGVAAAALGRWVGSRL